MSTIPEGGDKARELIADLVAHGCPVVLCTPHRHHGKCRDDCDRELDQPAGWASVDPDPGTAARYRPGWHTPALVTGHVLDAIDVDTKHGADLAEVIERAIAAGVLIVGYHATPSGGAHLFVASTGIATAAKPANGVDFRGGCADGSGRGLIYLPGSNRPKYPDRDYQVVQHVDWDRLAEVVNG